MGINYKAITINIAPKTLSDGFSAITEGNIAIDEVVTGSVKGFAFVFKVRDTSETKFNFNMQKKITSFNGTYDIDNILNKAVVFSVGTYKAHEIMNAVAAKLGKTTNILCDNHAPSYITYRSTGKEIISALWGWTDRLPQRQVNVFIRNNCINVIQRGHETGVVPLLKFANVTRNKKKILTLQDPLDTNNDTVSSPLVGEPEDNEPTYMNGTFTNGDAIITYVNGLVTFEQHAVDGFDETTTYQYSSNYPPAYLTGKTTITKDGKFVTSYSYQDDKLTTEIETEYDSEDTIIGKKTTRNYPIGQGMWGTSIEIDGITEYGGISQGAPGGKASPFAINQDSSIKKPPPLISTNKFNPYPKYMEGLPIVDMATLQVIADAVVWLHDKIETRISLESHDDNIFDFTNRILWNGQEYYLESNTVTQDAEKFVQRVEMVRWD